jgi:DNA repair protein RadA/Sms
MTSTKARVSRAAYRCTECGWTAVKWVGRCGECQAWGTVAEASGAGPGGGTGRTRAGAVGTPAARIGEVDATRSAAVGTGVSELDRVLGGGLVPGSVVLVAGEPGVGKSTLLLDVAARSARAGRATLYVTGEESAAQVRLRAERIEAMAADLFLVAETDLSTVLGHLEALAPALVVVDSVQTLASTEVEGAAGGVTQVREVAASLIAAAKARGITVLLVGHVTKDGSIAGPRMLEHLVDVVLTFEGDRHTRLRMARAVKNRYGPTDEVGCFDLTEGGIVALPDPSGLFLSSRDLQVSGTCVTVTLEGRRPVVAEVQALVAKAVGAAPRRVTHGVDSSRVAMILAALERRAKAPLGGSDAYISTVGGARVVEPAADLAVALALASAVLDRPVGPGVVAFGEVGLAGEIRPVGGIDRRLNEAVRLGFATAVVPAGWDGSAPSGIRVLPAADLLTAVSKGLAVAPVIRIH